MTTVSIHSVGGRRSRPEHERADPVGDERAALEAAGCPSADLRAAVDEQRDDDEEDHEAGSATRPRCASRRTATRGRASPGCCVSRMIANIDDADEDEHGRRGPRGSRRPARCRRSGTPKSSMNSAPYASTIVRPRTRKPQKANTCARPGTVHLSSFRWPRTSVASASTRLRSRPTCGRPRACRRGPATPGTTGACRRRRGRRRDGRHRRRRAEHVRIHGPRLSPCGRSRVPADVR